MAATVAVEMVSELRGQQRDDLDVDSLPVHVRDALVGFEQAGRDRLSSCANLTENTLAVFFLKPWSMVGMRRRHALERGGSDGMCVEVDDWHGAALPRMSFCFAMISADFPKIDKHLHILFCI